MTDETAASAAAPAILGTPRFSGAASGPSRADLEAKAEAAAAAEAAAVAKAAHDAAIATLQAAHDAALSKLDAWTAALASSLEKAKADPSHVDYSAAFARHAGLLADEGIAWINRLV